MKIITPLLTTCLMLLMLCPFAATAQTSLKSWRDMSPEKSIKDLLKYKKMYGGDTWEVEERISYSEKGCAACRTQRVDTVCFEFHYELTYLYFLTDSLNKILYHASKSLEYAYDNDTKSNAYYFLGQVYQVVNDYPTALEYYHLSLKAAQKNAQPKTAHALEGLSNVYLSMKDWKNASEYLHKSVAATNTLKDAKRKNYNYLFSYAVLITIYSETGQTDSIDYYAQLAKEAAAGLDSKEITNQDAIIRFNNEIISHFIKTKDFTKARLYIEEVEKLNNPYNEKYFAILKARYQLGIGNPSKAVELLSIDYTEWSADIQIELLEVLLQAYQKLGNDKKALEISQKLYAAAQQKYDEDKTNSSITASFKYNTLQQDVEIKRLQQQTALQHTRTILLLVALFSLLLLLLSFYWIIRQNRKKTLLLEKDLENKKIIEAQARELQNSSEQKLRFFANISHELRTPLTLIISPLRRLLQQNTLPETEKQTVQMAFKNAAQLKQLVNQILDLSKMDFKTVDVQVQEFLLADVTVALVQEFLGFAAYQKINFQVPAFIPDTLVLHSDAEKLSIILKNLLSNAFKFTPTGGQVNLNLSDDKDFVEITVSDNGRGIAAEDLPHIFERYFQTKQTTTPIEGGTGLGLAIVKEYTALLGGEISVQSKVGEGTVFKLRLPKKIAVADLPSEETQKVIKTKPETESGGVLQTPFVFAIKNETDEAQEETHLLIVEDNLDICSYLKTILGQEYRLSFAHNGRQALDMLQNNTPDLIISDLMMPVMDGFDFVKQLKNNAAHRLIPTVMLTARADLADKIMAANIGVDDYLVKPFYEEELTAVVRRLLQNAYQRKIYTETFAELENESTDAQDDKEKGELLVTKTLFQEEHLWLAELKQIVLMNMENTQFNINQLSEQIALSKSQINRKLKLTLGLTAKEFINEVRFAKAKELLEKRTFSNVKRVAYAVGFKDEKNFSRNFRQRFGKYPSEYLE